MTEPMNVMSKNATLVRFAALFLQNENFIILYCFYEKKGEI